MKKTETANLTKEEAAALAAAYLDMWERQNSARALAGPGAGQPVRSPFESEDDCGP